MFFGCFFKRILYPMMILMTGIVLPFLHADPSQEFPVLYQGRYRPAEAYGRLWLYEISHRQTLSKQDFEQFHSTNASPLPFLWSLEFNGNTAYQNVPLFWIGPAELKRLAGLPLKRNRFTFIELQTAAKDTHLVEEIETKDKKLGEDWKAVILSIKAFERLNDASSPLERSYSMRVRELQKLGSKPQEIAEILEREYPANQRLQAAGSLFKALPSRFKAGEWLPLKALTLLMYQPSSDSLQPIGNFTLYPDEHFAAIRNAYFQAQLTAENSSSSSAILAAESRLAETLQDGYLTIAGKVVQQAHGKNLSYPTLEQLKIETLYVKFPWIPLLILLYSSAAFLLIASCRSSAFFLKRAALGAFGLALFCHTVVLAMRCYILQRPPVSNMFETVIYVPWVAGCASLALPFFRRQPLALIASSAASVILLLIIEITGLNQSLDQVQAVLDSQFWLTIHVLLVVGSYGIFILGAVLGHFYLALFLKRRKEEGVMPLLGSLILQTMYGGTALLVAGTILGGIWAAESWGRFWDWDPKESWAFISSCFYLIWIHAYRFGRIGSFGLAVGAVSGLLAISFTWYGVNYILGTGLHSYGFGSGGEAYYYAFLGGEALFLTLSLWIHISTLKDTLSSGKKVS